MDHSPALEEVVSRKLESIDHLVAGYDDVRAEVDLERTTEHHKGGEVFRIHIRVMLPGHVIDADAKGDDIYALADEARDTLHGAVQRFKDQDVARRHAAE